MKPTLLVLAAGMGSRYGGLKQMDGLGPNGETIIDYSIYDAVQAGFGKVVYIVREYFREQFEQTVREKFRYIRETSSGANTSAISAASIQMKRMLDGEFSISWNFSTARRDRKSVV